MSSHNRPFDNCFTQELLKNAIFLQQQLKYEQSRAKNRGSVHLRSLFSLSPSLFFVLEFCNVRRRSVNLPAVLGPLDVCGLARLAGKILLLFCILEFKTRLADFTFVPPFLLESSVLGLERDCREEGGDCYWQQRTCKVDSDANF